MGKHGSIHYRRVSVMLDVHVSHFCLTRPTSLLVMTPVQEGSTRKDRFMTDTLQYNQGHNELLLKYIVCRDGFLSPSDSTARRS